MFIPVFSWRYALIQIFSKFGKVAKLDFLFHKSGPLRGKPRGFAFVEFTSKDVSISVLRKCRIFS